MTNNLQNKPEPAEFLLYQTEDGQTRLEVHIQEETVWAIQRLREYIVKGFAMDDERLKTIKMGNTGIFNRDIHHPLHKEPEMYFRGHN